MAILIESDMEYVSAVKGYFDKRVVNLYKMASDNGNEFEFEILLLCCCYIDALANIFTDVKLVNERFAELLIELGYTNDVDFSKVNLLSLEKQIRRYSIKNQKPGLPQKYEAWVLSELNKRDYSTGDNVVLDLLEKETLKKFSEMSSDIEKTQYGKILKEAVRNSTYAKILYGNYRNAAVHEALVRGHWEGVTREDKPFYIDIMDDESDLTFPTKFLIKVIENIIDKIYNKCTNSFYADEFA